jgi:hypothetical protein
MQQRYTVGAITSVAGCCVQGIGHALVIDLLRQGSEGGDSAQLQCLYGAGSAALSQMLIH